MTRKRLAIVGAGGFARELRWLVSEINSSAEKFEFSGFVVSDLERLGSRDSQDSVLGDFSVFSSSRLTFDAIALGIGSPKVRVDMAREIRRLNPNLEWPALVHPSVKFDAATCEFQEGAVVCAGVIATVHVTVAPLALVNLACTLGHETVVGAGSVLNPTVNVSGGARIGERVLVGTGAQILQYLAIGDDAVVGAGAVVTRDVASGQTVVGVPARPKGSG